MARAVARGWRALVALTLVGLLASVAVILFAPRKFTGVASVVLKTQTASSSGASSLISQVTGLGDAGALFGKSPMETEIEILSSRTIEGQVVDSLLLQASITAAAALPSRPLLTRVDAPGSFKRR